MYSRRFIALFAILAWLPVSSALAPAFAKDAVDTSQITIVEKLGAQLPLDVKLKTADGASHTFGELLIADKPTILVLGYYGCPMLCGVVSNALKDGLKELARQSKGVELGKDFRVVSVSIDPKEDVELAAEKRKNYLESLAMTALPEHSWEFAVAEAAESKRLAEAAGFNYFYDDDKKEYAHAAGIFVLTPGGKISRVLYGVYYPGRDLKLALLEASEGKLGSALEKLILWCYHYDPQGRVYAIYAIRLMRVGGAVAAVLMAAFLFFAFRGERRRQRSEGMTA